MKLTNKTIGELVYVDYLVVIDNCTTVLYYSNASDFTYSTLFNIKCIV